MTTAKTDDGRPADTVYWRSASQLAETPEFRDLLAREFPVGAADEPPDGVSRRSFLTAVAASVAAASLTGCRKPQQRIMPFTHRPEYLIPGVPLHYATALTIGGYGIGSLVRSNDGRPTKIEGHPEHPASLGGTNAFLQGELLNLYDPARSREPIERGHAEAAAGHGDSEPTARARFVAFLQERRAAAMQKKGAGLHVLLPRSASPTLARVIGRLKTAMPQAAVYHHAPVGADSEVAGAEIAFGRALDAQWKLDACDVVASFDMDLLGVDGDVVRNTKQWSKSRKITDERGSISRLYVAEGSYTVTGTNADHRFRVAPSQIPVALCALAAELGVGGDSALGKVLASYEGRAFAYKGKPNWIPALAKDLAANGGKSAVLVGPRQPAAAHAVAHAINAHLGNVGKTVELTKTPELLADARGLPYLGAALDGGSVDTAIAIGCNPILDAPADIGFAASWAKAEHSVHVGLHRDETALASEWHANLAHELETWGDAAARDGTVTIQQPLIAPLWHGLSAIEVLAILAGDDAPEGHELVRETWQPRARTDDFDAWWAKVLHDGYIAGTAAQPEGASIDFGRAARAVGEWQGAPAPTAANLELEIRPDPSVFDGRYSNNAWMQELPDPVTKLTWDNAVVVSRATAAALGVEGGDVVTLQRAGRSVEGPIWIVPGHADHVATVTLGYGRRMDPSCEIAAGVGFDAYALRTNGAPHGGPGLQIGRAGRTHDLVSSQDHGSLEGRPHYRSASLEHYKENPTFAPDMSPLAAAAKLHDHEGRGHDEGHGEGGAAHATSEQSLLKSLWDERDYSKGYQWGMVIDLNSCTGCNACVVACVSENNISMVGKGQVAVGREMHWIRMDRYFTTDAGEDPMKDDEPGVAHQPLPCMQCENAPCESVCPVGATVHSPEGLNDMAYNRCIGTRYCNNNCPYKVRRFNWFNFNLDVPKTQQMAFNPNVTVRARGVMEKCTYCVQRINVAKIDATREDREVRDGEIVPACAQGCPADAITFGNINDPNSRVSKLKGSNLNYGMLSEMNLKPRTTYLAKVKNPNPELVA